MSAIRRVTEEDIPWLHELCRQAYPAGYYDPIASERWVRGLMKQPSTVLLLRGSLAWLCTNVAAPPWDSKKLEARLLPVASSSPKAAWELAKMTKQAIDWAREQGASKFYFAAMTGVDLGPLARRFGAVPVSPSYVLDL